MKKYDEGYVLVYVTVVLLIFCLVATVILTGALRSLNAQQNAIAQMKDQYVAEGMIEKVMSQWGAYKDSFEKNKEVGDTGVKCIAIDDTTITLYAEGETVSITCKVRLSDGKYLAYEIGTVAPVESEEVPQ